MAEAYKPLPVPAIPVDLEQKVEIPANHKKVRLFDGVEDVESLTIFAMFRNNSKYLDWFFQRMSDFERYYACRFVYYFLENDSKDDTPDKLRTFIDGRQGKVITGSIARDYVNMGENFERTHTLAALRNYLVSQATPIKSKWSIFLDSHIFFPVDILEYLYMQTNPAEREIGMITPYTRQVFTLEQLARSTPLVGILDQNQDPKRLVDAMHYFDTYTIYCPEGQIHFPLCPFEKCRLCQETRRRLPDENSEYNKLLPLIPEQPAVVEVASAFGGFAIITSEALNHPRIRWGTLSFNATNKMSLCDHVLLCERIQSVLGKKVVVCQNTPGMYRIY